MAEQVDNTYYDDAFDNENYICQFTRKRNHFDAVSDDEDDGDNFMNAISNSGEY